MTQIITIYGWHDVGTVWYSDNMHIIYKGRLSDTTDERGAEVQRFLLWSIGPGVLVVDHYGTIKTSDLYAIYTHWCNQNDLVPMPKRALGRILTTIGCPAVRGTAGVRLRGGLRLP